MRKVRLMVAATLLIGGASACSDDSGGDNDTLSESEFQDQANELCKDATEDTPIDLSKLNRELDKLVPPASEQDEVSEMITQFYDYQKAIDRGETPSAQTVRKADRLADQLGLPECAEVLDA